MVQTSGGTGVLCASRSSRKACKRALLTSAAQEPCLTNLQCAVSSPIPLGLCVVSLSTPKLEYFTAATEDTVMPDMPDSGHQGDPQSCCCLLLFRAACLQRAILEVGCRHLGLCIGSGKNKAARCSRGTSRLVLYLASGPSNFVYLSRICVCIARSNITGRRWLL